MNCPRFTAVRIYYLRVDPVINNKANENYFIDLSFLNIGAYDCVCYEDSDDPQVVHIRREKVKKGDDLQIKMKRHGGFVGVFSK